MKFSSEAFVLAKGSMSAYQLAKEAGLSQPTVRAYEKGSVPSLDAAFRLAEVLNCSVHDFSDEAYEPIYKPVKEIQIPPPVDKDAFTRAAWAKLDSGQAMTLDEERAIAGDKMFNSSRLRGGKPPVEEPLPDIDELPLPVSLPPFTRTGNREEARWGGPVVQPTPEDIVEDEPPLTDEDRAALIERERQRLERATPSPTGPVRQPWTWTPSIFDKVAE